jgi:hypothetical protein
MAGTFLTSLTRRDAPTGYRMQDGSGEATFTSLVPSANNAFSMHTCSFLFRGRARSPPARPAQPQLLLFPAVKPLGGIMVMRRYAFVFATLLILVAYPALAANCTYWTAWEYQVTQYEDGTISILITGITEYAICDVNGGTGGSPAPNPGGGSCSSTPPTVTLASIDTTDPYQPIVGVSVTSNDPYDPVSVVNLEVNGSTVNYLDFVGNGQYRLRLPPITDFQEGSASIVGKACTGTAACNQDSAMISRFTPSPQIASGTISASWQEEEERGPVTRTADYNQQLRQTYRTTSFSCCETGENSHVQIGESLVTLSGYDPMPWWNAGVNTSGTNTLATYGLADAANPVACTFPVLCSSKSGSAAATFGYSPSVHEAISSFVIDGANALFSNGSLDLSFP